MDWPVLLLSEGYRPVRHFWDMIRPLGAELPTPQIPEGLDVRPVRPDHLRAIWKALRDVTPDHWQYVEDEWTKSRFESKKQTAGTTGGAAMPCTSSCVGPGGDTGWQPP